MLTAVEIAARLMRPLVNARLPDDLDGRVVVITGASSGIGRASARACAERGAAVVLGARDEDALREAVAECEAAGSHATAVPTDVTSQDEVEVLARRAYERFGRIDVWVNNAAVMAYGTFEVIPADVYHKVIDTNLFGQIHGARAVLPYFRRQGAGVLINVASLYAKLTSPYVSPYVTSKYALLGFSECLRQELADVGNVHVCTILPQAVDTPIFRHVANYTGRPVTALPPTMDPDRVVRAILRCIQHPVPKSPSVKPRASPDGSTQLFRVSTTGSRLVSCMQWPSEQGRPATGPATSSDPWPSGTGSTASGGDTAADYDAAQSRQLARQRLARRQ